MNQEETGYKNIKDCPLTFALSIIGGLRVNHTQISDNQRESRSNPNTTT